MKPEIDSDEKLRAWIKQPVSAVFQGQDLIADSATIAKLPLKGCVFLGCDMDGPLIVAAANAKCLILPSRPEMAFKPFRPSLYKPVELYDKFDPSNARPSYLLCRDYLIYDSAYKEVKTPSGKSRRVPRETEIEETLMRRIHDWSIEESLNDLLDDVDRHKCVAIMGGHDAPRSSPVYAQTAMLALKLTQKGFVIVTGGGPGLMEAANLGGYAAGFDDPDQIVATALQVFVDNKKDADKFNSDRWLEVGYTTWKAMGKPKDAMKSRNIGVPTWFYGHEPPNLFATDIAKYFENSVREEGLLAIARGGIIYADGNGGTVQEIFQDANQNYYRTYNDTKSAMVLFSTAYWNPPAVNYNNPAKERQKPAYLLLHKLATEKAFDDYLFMSDLTDDVVDFIVNHPPKVEPPA